MEPIEILSCIGCGKIFDQYTMLVGCTECNGKLFKQVRPSLFRILCWIFNHPKHVVNLIKEDIREKYQWIIKSVSQFLSRKS